MMVCSVGFSPRVACFRGLKLTLLAQHFSIVGPGWAVPTNPLLNHRQFIVRRPYKSAEVAAAILNSRDPDEVFEERGVAATP